MIERKQSFLERLTGAQVIDDAEDRDTGNVLLRDTRRPAPARYAEVSEVEDDMRTMYQEEEPEGEEEEIEAGLAIDMYESDNELVIQCMIAGVTTENLQITITRDMVTIRGKRIAPQGIREDRYIEKELYWGVFSREITLPYEINTDGAEAVEKYGLLIIRLPRLDTNRTQELKVKSI